MYLMITYKAQTSKESILKKIQSVPHFHISLVIYYHHQKEKRPNPACNYPGIIREAAITLCCTHFLIYFARIVITVIINDVSN